MPYCLATSNAEAGNHQDPPRNRERSLRFCSQAVPEMSVFCSQRSEVENFLKMLQVKTRFQRIGKNETMYTVIQPLSAKCTLGIEPVRHRTCPFTLVTCLYWLSLVIRILGSRAATNTTCTPDSFISQFGTSHMTFNAMGIIAKK